MISYGYQAVALKWPGGPPFSMPHVWDGDGVQFGLFAIRNPTPPPTLLVRV